jgi:membrane fusion protein, copper/silver efflux system
MKKTGIIITIFVIAALIVAGGVYLNTRYHILTAYFPKANVYLSKAKAYFFKAKEKALYYCPMHPTFTSDKPGNCGICGMTLVKRQEADKPADQNQELSQKKILYYRNPMNPTVTSPVPMKDQMGMDYVAVYEEEKSAAPGSVYISPQKQQLIGVKKAKVEVRKLIGQILTVGNVAYDPSLFVAQQEYLQILKSSKHVADSNIAYAIQGSDLLINTTKRKLIQMGMSESEITELAASGKPEQSLFLPEGDKIWVYVVVYEYETGLLKEGQKVEVESPAYPGEIFTGKIVSVGALLDPVTRSLKVRCLVDNPENKLKLEMYVNVNIEYDLGEKLAVPEEAVMHTGMRDIVFITDPNGYFKSTDVSLGQKVRGYYEVLAGLLPNEEVVISGNFLVDSESKLNAVLNQMTEPNK